MTESILVWGARGSRYTWLYEHRPEPFHDDWRAANGRGWALHAPRDLEAALGLAPGEVAPFRLVRDTGEASDA